MTYYQGRTLAADADEAKQIFADRWGVAVELVSVKHVMGDIWEGSALDE